MFDCFQIIATVNNAAINVGILEDRDEPESVPSLSCLFHYCWKSLTQRLSTFHRAARII